MRPYQVMTGFYAHGKKEASGFGEFLIKSGNGL
jgi:hypothetical protein